MLRASSGDKELDQAESLVSEPVGARHAIPVLTPELSTASPDTPSVEGVGVCQDIVDGISSDPRGITMKSRILIVDDVWGSGRTSNAVRGRVEAAGGRPATCVLHFNPYRSLFKGLKPDYYGAITDAWIVYPWEIDRDLDTIPSGQGGVN